jgi:secreted trypsin-like serine protease
MPRRLAAFALIACWCTPAAALVGGAAVVTGTGVGRHVVLIVGSRSNFCTGTAIARDLVLTVAHCVLPGAEYKIVEYDAAHQPLLKAVTSVARHPAFKLETMLAHRATADVALLWLQNPAKGKTPSMLGAPALPLVSGAKFTVAGVGVTVRGDGKSSGVIRVANLIATGRPGTLQIRLVDPEGQGTRAGLGACTGDSGAPVFEYQQGTPVIVGVVSWSTGPNGSVGCGGLTGVTPLTLYRDWILQTVRQWGFAL